MSITGGLLLFLNLPHSLPAVLGLGEEGTELWEGVREGRGRESQGRGRGSSEDPREYRDEKEDVDGGVQG